MFFIRRLKNNKWEGLLRKLERSLIMVARPLLPKFIRRYLNRKREPLETRRIRTEFHSRIKQINFHEYLDVSHKPTLNVIILVVDCLRNSRLSSQGYSRETTPFMDSFKSRFNAISAAPWTYPSVASILTGLYPHNHNALLAGKIKYLGEPSNFLKLRDDVLTLPEILFSLGYKVYFGTAIFLAYRSLAARVVPNKRGCDFGGFQQEWEPAARAEGLLSDLTKWIAKEKRKRFFAYVQLGDLHVPLNPPDSFSDFFGNVKNLPNIDRWDFETPERQKADIEKFQEYRQNRQLLYDNTLRYVDYAIERFYDSLKDMGILDSTILVVTADHGEEFWDHAELEARYFYHQGADYVKAGGYGTGHGQSVFNELIEVPLLLSGPVPHKEHTHFVSSVDIVPTVMDLLGVTHNMRFDGRNIFEVEGGRPLLSEAASVGYEKKALVVDKYKLIYSKDDGIEWLFDLEKDPHEQHPIVDREVTSLFVEKLNQILREDDKRKIRRIAAKKGLRKP